MPHNQCRTAVSKAIKVFPALMRLLTSACWNGQLSVSGNAERAALMTLLYQYLAMLTKLR